MAFTLFMARCRAKGTFEHVKDLPLQNVLSLSTGSNSCLLIMVPFVSLEVQMFAAKALIDAVYSQAHTFNPVKINTYIRVYTGSGPHPATCAHSVDTVRSYRRESISPP